MYVIDLKKPIEYIYASFRYFEDGEKHVTRFCKHDVLLLVFDGVLKFTENGEDYEIHKGEYYIQKNGSCSFQLTMKGNKPMLSFGQRLKVLRNESSLSQADLAEKLGVSVQSVSKWECDAYFPDVSLLLPLSVILGVTTDCLLGAGTNEEDDIKALEEELEKIAEEYGSDWRGYNFSHLSYEATKSYLKKHPLDYEVKLSCANFLLQVLYNSTWPNAYSIPTEEFKAMHSEGVQLINSIINHDKNPCRQIKAREILMIYLSMTEKWDEAEAVALELPDICGLRKEVLARLAGERRDLEKALELRKSQCAELANDFLHSLYMVGRRTSIFGNERKQEAIDAWNNMKNVSLVSTDIFSKYGIEEYLSKTPYLIDAICMISNENLAIDNIEASISAMEEATDVAINIYNKIKELGADADCLKEVKEAHKYIPEKCRNRVYPNEDNPLSRHPKTKICQNKLNALN